MEKRHNYAAAGFLLLGIGAAGRAFLGVPEGVTMAELSLTVLLVIGALLLTRQGLAALVCGVAHCQPCCACQRAAGQGFFRQLCSIFGTAAVVHRADGQSLQRSAHQTLSIRPFCALWGAGWPYFYSIILRGSSLHL